jgi:hypothetical protein
MSTPKVSREQAELLKKIGYDVPTWKYYDADGLLVTLYRDAPYNFNGETIVRNYSAPTLDEATRWLREVKGWHIKTQPIYMNKMCWEADIIAVPLLALHDTVYGDTHDLTQSAGIDLILKKLNDGK